MKKHLIRILSSAILAGFVGFSILSGQDLHNSYLRSRVGDAVVKVHPNANKRSGGTGFSMKASSGKRVIVTNEHVCSGAKTDTVMIKSDKGLTSFKKILYIDEQHDICILEGDFRLGSVSLGSTPEVGDFHYIVGHPGLRNLTVSKGEYIGNEDVELINFKVKERNQCVGRIIEIDDPFARFFFGQDFICLKVFKSYASSAIAYGGNSGSPVVNKWGNVIGILFAGSRDQNTDNYLVPLKELKRVLELY